MITFRTALKAVAAYLLAHPGHTHVFTDHDLARMCETPTTLEQWADENGLAVDCPITENGSARTWRVHAPA